jgi:hypothetical protein
MPAVLEMTASAAQQAPRLTKRHHGNTKKFAVVMSIQRPPLRTEIEAARSGRTLMTLPLA